MAPRQIDEKVRAAPSVEQLSNLKEVLRLLASSPLVKIIDARASQLVALIMKVLFVFFEYNLRGEV